jgi:hypothetical protein
VVVVVVSSSPGSTGSPTGIVVVVVVGATVVVVGATVVVVVVVSRSTTVTACSAPQQSPFGVTVAKNSNAGWVCEQIVIDCNSVNEPNPKSPGPVIARVPVLQSVYEIV